MPEAVGDYLLETPIPSPEGARLFRASDARGEPVRLRVSDPEQVPPDRGVRAFERLTAALTRWGRQRWPGLESPVGTVLPDESGRFALATEWRDGRPLAEALPSRGFERLERAVRIAIDVGRTLAQLHDAEAVHGAVAQHNVWVGDEGTTLLSFWWSQANLRDHPGPSAPEAIASGRYDAAADQWAWGRMLADLLAHDVDRPGDLQAILTRATERQPGDRVPSMNEAVASLETFERTLRTDDVSVEQPAAADEARTEDLARRTLEPPTEDLGSRAAEPPTEDLGRQHPQELPTNDVSDEDHTVEAPVMKRPEPGPPEDANADAQQRTMQLRRARPRSRMTPIILWAAALGVLVLALILLARLPGGGD